MDRHNATVADIASSIRLFHKLHQPFRVSHGSSHSTRPRHSPAQNVVDISMLSNVLSVDVQQRTCTVEPNVPMDRLVEATLPHGLVPPVVMEFPGITAGGGFAGTSGESSSFKHGFFNETVNSIEIVLGDGSIVNASPNDNSDLFHGAAGALGTLGITTLLELRLVEAKSFVKVSYSRFHSVSGTIWGARGAIEQPGLDYVDGILFSQDHGVLVTGSLANIKPDDQPARTFSHPSDPWFYLHVKEITKTLDPSSVVEEYVPLSEYLFRYDRAGFWVGRQGYTYFKVVPFNRFFRWLLDDYSHTRTLYHALHASQISTQFIIQDLGLPYDTAEQFVQWVDRETGIWPLWLCPLRASPMPTFHPVTTASGSKIQDNVSNIGHAPETGLSQPMLNIGVWGWGPQDRQEFIETNCRLEGELLRLGGRKWLYAHAWYEENKFWDIYGRSWYQTLRARYHAELLPSVYDKIKSNGEAIRQSFWSLGSSWLSTWPIGGLYGMVLATTSGDIGLHQRAKWRYRHSG
ncbi:FAD-binding domain-containing protein [Sarocladium strictum]